MRKLAGHSYAFPGFVHLSWPVLLRQLHYHYDGERTENCGRGGDRRVCMEVKRMMSLEMVTSLTLKRTSRIVRTVLFSLLPATVCTTQCVR